VHASAMSIVSRVVVAAGSAQGAHRAGRKKRAPVAISRQHRRTLPNRFHRAILLPSLLFIPIFLQAAHKRGITEKDLFEFVWIGDPQISPDGSRVAFVRVTVNEKKLGYDTAIWTVATSGTEE